MEKFIVVALTASLPNKFEQCQVIKEGDVIIATHSRVFGPDSKEACEKWMAENCGKPTPGTGSRPNQPGAPPNQPPQHRDGDPAETREERAAQSDPRFINLFYLQYGLIALVTLMFVLIVFYGIYSGSFDNTDKARGLITYLVAVSTVAIATLAILTAMVVRDFKERFASAKEVLTILVGILGTIVGFYYGQAASGNKPGDQNPSNTEANKNANANASANANANANKNANSNTNANSNANSNANANANKTNAKSLIFRAPFEKNRYVSVVYDNAEKKLIRQ